MVTQTTEQPQDVQGEQGSGVIEEKVAPISQSSSVEVGGDNAELLNQIADEWRASSQDGGGGEQPQPQEIEQREPPQ
jgi:hypothetical protein